jgi:hypothetical protein
VFGSKSMNFTIEGFDPIEMDGYTHYKPFVVNDLNQIIEGSRYKIISKNLINLEDALLPAVMLV